MTFVVVDVRRFVSSVALFAVRCECVAAAAAAANDEIICRMHIGRTCIISINAMTNQSELMFISSLYDEHIAH